MLRRIHITAMPIKVRFHETEKISHMFRLILCINLKEKRKLLYSNESLTFCVEEDPPTPMPISGRFHKTKKTF